MAAVLKPSGSDSARGNRSSLPSRTRRVLQSATQPTTSHRPVAPSKAAGPASLVEISKKKQPLGIRLLSILHQLSSVGTAAVVVLVLAGYGYSVHMSRQLSQSEQRLSQLQRSEQQLTTVNEVLKNHIAEQVEQTSVGLKPPQLGNVIFLEPAPARDVPNEAPVDQPISIPRQPLGY